MTHFVLIGLGVLIAVLTVVAALDLLPSLRIVPDNTRFDFTRFRRISFPISALLSIVAITLFFTHGLNFGIDFKGGTLLEVQAKSGTADIPGMRATLSALGLGDVQLQQFGGPAEVLIRVAEQPGGDAAQQAAVQKVRGALGDSVDYRRVEVVGPRVSGELLAYGMLGLMLAIFSPDIRTDSPAKKAKICPARTTSPMPSGRVLPSSRASSRPSSSLRARISSETFFSAS